jgi:hypothetical protein
MPAVFGIDTSGPATDALNTQATPWIGGLPKFWGRYFNGTTTNRTFQYETSENAVLSQLGIPVLCFARQMWAVGDATAAQGHARLNMQGVVDAFGAPHLLGLNIAPILYLDLEPETHHPEHVMVKTGRPRSLRVFKSEDTPSDFARPSISIWVTTSNPSSISTPRARAVRLAREYR